MADTYKWIGDGVVKIGPPKEEKYYGKGETIPHEEIPEKVLEDFIRDGMIAKVETKKAEAEKPPPDPEQKSDPILKKPKAAKEPPKPEAKKPGAKATIKKPFKKGKKK